MKKKILAGFIAALFIVAVTAGATWFLERKAVQEKIKNDELANEQALEAAINYVDLMVVEQQNEETSLDTEPVVEIDSQASLPSASYLEVDFICQAPLQTPENWVFHEESCEEAAFLQAYNYQKGIKMTAEEADKLILEMIAWQENYFGSHKDLYGEEMKEFIVEFSDLEENQVRVISDVTIKDIERELAADRPVIAGAMGETLENPFYPYPGYHMLTIIGYTEDRFITNDNGTRRGADYSYEKELFMKSVKEAGNQVLVLDI